MAIRGEKTLSQLGSQFKVHPIQIAKWRKATIERMPDPFVDGRSHIKRRDSEPDREALFGEIGRLKVELDWLKKKSARSTEDLRALVDRDHPNLSVRRQCELLGINRASLYYEPAVESEENLPLMRLLDEQYTRTPFYGSRRMAAWLSSQGFEANRKRVSRLMRLMEIEAAYPKPRLSEIENVRRATQRHGAASTQTDPGKASLLVGENGLDNGVHFIPYINSLPDYCDVFRIGHTALG